MELGVELELGNKHDLDYGHQGSLVAVKEWREGIRLGVWSGSVNKKLDDLEYNEVSKEISILSTRPYSCQVCKINI